MADNAEYNRLVNRRAAKRREKAACEERIAKCDNLLARLRQVRNQVSNLKDDFKQTKKTDKKLSKEKFDWKGYTYDTFKGKMDVVKNENESYYDDSLDHVLDSLNNEITRIQNQRNSEYGLLGDLASAINSLSNSIRNFFN